MTINPYIFERILSPARMHKRLDFHWDNRKVHANFVQDLNGNNLVDFNTQLASYNVHYIDKFRGSNFLNCKYGRRTDKYINMQIHHEMRFLLHSKFPTEKRIKEILGTRNELRK